MCLEFGGDPSEVFQATIRTPQGPPQVDSASASASSLARAFEGWGTAGRSPSAKRREDKMTKSALHQMVGGLSRSYVVHPLIQNVVPCLLPVHIE